MLEADVCQGFGRDVIGWVVTPGWEAIDVEVEVL